MLHVTPRKKSFKTIEHIFILQLKYDFIVHYNGHNNKNNILTNKMMFHRASLSKMCFPRWARSPACTRHLNQPMNMLLYACNNSLTTAFTKSMETQIHALILFSIFPSFTIWWILLIGNILFLLHTKYQTILSNTLEVMAINMAEGWLPKSALSLFELKSTFTFVIWN